MSHLLEVIHTITPRTPATFDRYVEIYEEFSVPVFNDCGWELLGAFKLTTGNLGRDLLMIRFDSVEDREKKSAALMTDTRVTQKLPEALQRAGIGVGEVVATGRPVPYADDRRVDAEIQASDPSRPRQFALVRHNVTLGSQLTAYGALETIAKNIEAVRSARLALAYDREIGKRGMLSEVWSTPAPIDLSYGKSDTDPGPYQALREAAPDGSIELLNPLPYSPLQ
jgi:hypothetical protein